MPRQGLRCKNKKTRVVCIEIIDLIIAGTVTNFRHSSSLLSDFLSVSLTQSLVPLCWASKESKTSAPSSTPKTLMLVCGMQLLTFVSLSMFVLGGESPR
jgi:hypothetical protein